MEKRIKTAHRKQRGFVSTEIAIAGLVASALAISTAVLTRNESMDDLAYVTGKNAGQVNSAIRSYIAENGLNTPAATYNNITWLKSASDCGGSATGTEGYLPCNFPEALALGLSYQIDITNTAGRVESVMELGVPHDSAEYVPYLSGQVVSGARGADVMSIAPGVGNTYFTAQDNEDGFITLTASNDPGNDIYLKKDGSVLPTADFDWNNKSITNVAEVEADNIEASSMVTSPTITTDTITSSDTTKKIDFLGNSVLTGVEMDRTILRDYQAVDDPCLEPGQLAIESGTGRLLTCSNQKLWESGSGSNGIIAEDLDGSDGYVEYANGMLDMWGLAPAISKEASTIIYFPRSCPYFINGQTTVQATPSVKYDVFEAQIHDISQSSMYVFMQSDHSSWVSSGEIYWRVICKV
ncbi:hypothetical protein [Endozoicomonas sp. ALC066]|uniref:hypothetical protein n=1 Tax=Endozoicomonas sp. ALC066 TaxID=3403078 RepID=UPI003BB4989B